MSTILAQRTHSANYALFGVLSLLLHATLFWWWQQRPPITPPRIKQTTIVELSLVRPAPPPPVIAPPPPPPPVIEPKIEPKPLPPKPQKKPAPKPKPKPKPQLTPEPVAPPPEVTPAPAPVIAAPPPPEPLVAAPPEPELVPASTRATSKRNPKPAYPYLARRRGWEGKVLLSVEVLANGKPGNISVAQSSGRTILDEAAVKTVRQWLFEPAHRGSEAVVSTMTLSIVFELQK